MYMRPGIQVAVEILACLLPVTAQQQPHIRVDVRLVNVAFTARDSRGELITDLSRDEVEVFEDGLAQTVSFFARAADLPLSLALLVDASGSQDHFVKPHQRDLKNIPRQRVELARPGDAPLFRQSPAGCQRFHRPRSLPV